MEPVPGKLWLPGRLENADRHSVSCFCGLLDHSLILQTPQQALREPRRRLCGAPEHLQELPSSLHGANFKLPDTPTSSSASLPNTSKSSQAASMERISSSQRPRQAGKQASKRASEQAGKKTSKRASIHASRQPSKPTNM